MIVSRRRHQKALEHIAELEAENAKLDRRIAAAEALPPEVSADGVSDAELRSYEASQTVERIIRERGFAVDQHPLSRGQKKPERRVPILDDAYFEAKRPQPFPVGFYSASAYMGATGYWGGTVIG